MGIEDQDVNDMASSEKGTASRQRLIDALNHKQLDRVSIDFGGTAVIGKHVSCGAAIWERSDKLPSQRY